MFCRSMLVRTFVCVASSLLVSAVFLSTVSTTAVAATLPAEWQQRWNSPPDEDRPLKIAHTIAEQKADQKGFPVFTENEIGGPDGLPYFFKHGLGGLATNVSFNEYLRSEKRWQDFCEMIDLLAKHGKTIWIYDEQGYPSASAGGLVLKENPQFEALELAYDASKSGDEAFTVRPAYEFTHASNNYAAYRRYPNLLDAAACRCFIEKTHEEYRRRVGQHFGKTIVATFTDEPSLIAVNLGPMPENVRDKIRVDDPIDPTVKSLPVVPWARDLPAEYQKRYGEDILKQQKSLFTGDTDEDRRVRRQYWALVADRVTENYLGQIQKWCHENHLLSSGHQLYEESIIHHVPLYGNALQSIEKMDIPGMDQLSSDPTAVIRGSWLTAAIPSSAAMLNGGRRVMTEVSDFSETMGGKGPVPLDGIRATAAWQAAWGVTDFTLYYTLSHRPVEDMRAYGDFVGRLNAILKPAKIDRRVLLYYPIDSLWEEYHPVAEKLNIKSQSDRAKAIAGSFTGTGRKLQRSQLPVTLIDYRGVDKAELKDASLALAGHEYRSIIIPAETKLGPTEAAKLDAFQKAGGTVIKLGTPEGDKQFADFLEQERPVSPHDMYVTYGRFNRDGRTIHLLVNTGDGPFSGHLRTEDKTLQSVLVLDPATGATQDRPVQAGLVPVELKTPRNLALR